MFANWELMFNISAVLFVLVAGVIGFMAYQQSFTADTRRRAKALAVVQRRHAELNGL